MEAGPWYAQPDPATMRMVEGVPGYSWRHGCGATSVGMWLGFWDRFYPDLIPGDAATQTEAVNRAIASGGWVDYTTQPWTAHPWVDGYGNFEDYCLPLDPGENPPRTDDYVTAARTPHKDNSVADFMFSSQSGLNLFYGNSWVVDIVPSIYKYVDYRDIGYRAVCEVCYINQIFPGTDIESEAAGWEFYRAEIDAGRPCLLVVASYGMNATDHLVIGIGYGYAANDGRPVYACLDTWAPAEEVRWQLWRGDVELEWGVWGIYATNFVDNHSLYWLAVMAEEWLKKNCNELNDWCHGSDRDYNGKVNLTDYADLVEHW
jgi:hypothetical protein